MPRKKSDNFSVTDPAPWYRVPDRQIISVEHPGLIKNIEKGIETLGGQSGIREALDPERISKPISLTFHPEDQASQRLTSNNRPTNNLLMKITVPIRTGRKRKRGTNDSFKEDQSFQHVRKDACHMLRSLKDNPQTSDVEILGTIDQTHVFRTMPDFSYATNNNRIMNEVKNKILPAQYPLLKAFQLDLSTRHNLSADLLPPQILSPHQVPTNYSYRQNPAVKRTLDPETNLPQTANLSLSTKIFTPQIQFDTETIPLGPEPTAPPLSTQPANFIGLVTLLRHIFDSRPIWTRRALLNQIPSSAPQFLVRYAVAYVAYAMRSGPWRDTYIRYGVDPRSSPDYRVYQTLLLQLVPREKRKYQSRNLPNSKTQPSQVASPSKPTQYSRTFKPSTDKTSHIFNPKPPYPTDGKSWQLIDLCENDPQLKSLVETPHIRTCCEPRYFGWYLNGTIAKLKVVLRSKADAIMEGETPNPRDYDRFLKLPEEYDADVVGTATDSRAGTSASPAPSSGTDDVDFVSGFFQKHQATKKELEWSASYRSMCKTLLGARPKPGRLSKTKPKLRKGYLGIGQDKGHIHEEGEADQNGKYSARTVQTASPARSFDGTAEDAEMEGEAEDEEAEGDDLDLDMDQSEQDEDNEEGNEVDENVE